MRRVVICLCFFLLTSVLIRVGVVAQDMPITLEIGQPYTFSVQEGAAFDDLTLFKFSPPEAALIISLLPADSDIAVEFIVYDAEGAEIGRSYNLDGRSFSLPRNYFGDVLIRAGRQEWVDTGGEMTILVQVASIRGLITDEVLTRHLDTGNELGVYVAEVAEGQLVSYGLSCEECGITVIQPDGQIFDSAGLYRDPGAYLAQLHWGGKYTFIVEAPPQGMDYELTYREIEPLILAPETPVSIEMGLQPTILAFESAGGKAWEIASSLPATGGRELRVMAFDAQRPLYESTLAGDQGSGPDGNARIEPFVAPQDGTYYVLAFYYDYSGLDVPAEGTVTLRPVSLRSLVPDIALDGDVTAASGPVTYLYEGQSGEIITLDVLHTGGPSGLGVDVIGPSDDVMRMGGLNVLSVNTMLELPEAGTYRIIVNAVTYGEPDLSYRIVLAQE
ncbi:hypothetical protein G4Y79_00170 [Phototrophicus methaneseepsis]|uniref:Peptidase C-terminal archaeal/bacterial domain-containing protein n=1 Tax=Phototrophicus methaneseepsis TaxID=2710758 RepID=A0A7S8E9G1_9CHLR|nr:hypothetical protein [Phototrophicus methaneseepsis]QPC82826.1 hypothetical protein G4Y79_00170 [Phototrophicus methaneseepsis]